MKETRKITAAEEAIIQEAYNKIHERHSLEYKFIVSVFVITNLVILFLLQKELERISFFITLIPFFILNLLSFFLIRIFRVIHVHPKFVTTKDVYSITGLFTIKEIPFRRSYTDFYYLGDLNLYKHTEILHNAKPGKNYTAEVFPLLNTGRGGKYDLWIVLNLKES
jgi:amino acid transporter